MDVSSAARKSVLAPGFVGDHRNAVGQVETAVSRLHGQTYTAFWRERFQNAGWQTTGFRAKHKHIARLEMAFGKRAAGFAAEGKQAMAGKVGQTCLPVGVGLERCVFVVI